jgi:cation diffusion facilitator CzcD-associated flavoprotein CzcO
MQDGAQVSGLDELAREVSRQYARLNYPPPRWTAPVAAPGGGRALDVAIVGAGMCGLTLAHALKREGVHDIALYDEAPAEREGPWIGFARMETLRSPKHLTSPDMGLPALTFRAWYEAQFGIAAWNALYKIPRRMWHDYLVWLRRTLDLPVENGAKVTKIVPVDGLFRVEIAGRAPVHARKVVLATGRGAPKWPAFLDRAALAPLVAHSSDPVDFEALRGRRVAVLGGGASAFDNAGCALEAGAADVRLYIRRPYLPQINKFKAMGYAGFQRGFARLPDAARWRLMRHAFGSQVPPPHESVLRCTKHAAFSLHASSPWQAVARERAELAIRLPSRTDRADFAIVCTGFGVDPGERPEIAHLAGDIARWADRYAPPEDAADGELAAFPYLDGRFAFVGRVPGRTPWLADLHAFNFSATLSHGLLSGDIPALGIGAARLSQAIVEDLFAASLAAHEADLRKLDDRELAPTPFYVPPELRGDKAP